MTTEQFLTKVKSSILLEDDFDKLVYELVDPLGEKIEALEKEKEELESNIIRQKKVVTAFGDYCNKLVALTKKDDDSMTDLVVAFAEFIDDMKDIENKFETK